LGNHSVIGRIFKRPKDCESGCDGSIENGGKDAAVDFELDPDAIIAGLREFVGQIN